MPPPLCVLGADPQSFPDPESALKEPNGLLAIGGDLSTDRLLAAYRQGIFPWFENDPILWWCPDPRAVLFLKDLKVSTSLRKTLSKSPFDLKMDEDFSGVVSGCAAPRMHQGTVESETWITEAMKAAYLRLHQLGYAHSIEAYQDGKLVGGIYGVSIGHNFFGESMFSIAPNASKIALVYLVKQLIRWDFEWLDCQIPSEHLFTLGATLIPRREFLSKLKEYNKFDTKLGKWILDKDLSNAL